MVEFEVTDVDYWEKLAPSHKRGKPSPWDSLLQQVGEGKIIRIPVEDEKQKKGSRIGISRRARSKGFKVEFREDDNWLVIRKSEAPLHDIKTKAQRALVSSETSAPVGRKRGRKPKNTIKED